MNCLRLAPLQPAKAIQGRGLIFFFFLPLLLELDNCGERSLRVLCGRSVLSGALSTTISCIDTKITNNFNSSLNRKQGYVSVWSGECSKLESCAVISCLVVLGVLCVRARGRRCLLRDRKSQKLESRCRFDGSQKPGSFSSLDAVGNWKPVHFLNIHVVIVASRKSCNHESWSAESCGRRGWAWLFIITIEKCRGKKIRTVKNLFQADWLVICQESSNKKNKAFWPFQFSSLC